VTRVVTAAACLDHDPGPGHPERPSRLATVLTALQADPMVELVTAAPAPIEPLLARHTRSYLDGVAALSAAGHGDFGADTPVDRATWTATLAAAGAALAALDHALTTGRHAFAAIRPPGHHALPESGMGFCLVNHIAVLAAEAYRRGAERVLIVDWDVHHGNGTQAMVAAESSTRFVSLHQWPWYPGTGATAERGAGNCFNVPMPAGLASAVYVDALWDGIVAATQGWAPDVVLVSAGFDAMHGDPLGGFTLEPADYATWVGRLRERFPTVPLVGLMEGGYVPARLADGVLATVRAMR
jgi:acetoin utilization deacetylase AcuC-like enzyme